MKNIEINEAAAIVKDGNLLIIPFDKGNFIICSAQLDAPIAKLREYVKYPSDQGLNIWVDNDGRVNRHIREVPEVAWDLFDSTEGDVIVIMPDGMNISKNALFPDQSVAISITNYDWAKKIIQAAKSPLVAAKLGIGRDLPANLKKEGYILNLPLEKKIAATASSPIIKVDVDSSIEIIRHAGKSNAPHL